MSRPRKATRDELASRLTTSDQENHLLHRALRAVMGGTVTWFGPRNGYRLGTYDEASPSGARAIIEFAPGGQAAGYYVHDLDEYARQIIDASYTTTDAETHGLRQLCFDARAHATEIQNREWAPKVA